jgi:hypothetical protein
MVQDSKYEVLDIYITRAMLHAESVCLLKHKHTTPWSPAIGRATSSIRYWDLRIKRGGIRDTNDTLLDYHHELSGVGAEFDIYLTVRLCIHQINNARSKLKDVVNNAVDLRTQFEVDLAMAVVEHKMPEFRSGETFMECDKDILVQKELKSRENRRTSKRSWQKLGRQIWGHLKPHTLHKSKLNAVEVSGVDDGSWSRIDTKEQVEELLINRNIKQFSHAGDTPFGYTPLGDELGHTGEVSCILRSLKPMLPWQLKYYSRITDTVNLLIASCLGGGMPGGLESLSVLVPYVASVIYYSLEAKKEQRPQKYSRISIALQVMLSGCQSKLPHVSMHAEPLILSGLWGCLDYEGLCYGGPTGSVRCSTVFEVAGEPTVLPCCVCLEREGY